MRNATSGLSMSRCLSMLSDNGLPNPGLDDVQAGKAMAHNNASQ